MRPVDLRLRPSASGQTPKSWSARPWRRVAAGLLSIALLCGGGAFLFFTTRAKIPTASSTANSPAEAKKGSLNPLTPPLGMPPSETGISPSEKIKSYVEQYDGGTAFSLRRSLSVNMRRRLRALAPRLNHSAHSIQRFSAQSDSRLTLACVKSPNSNARQLPF